MKLTKDPNAILDYIFDWSDWLDENETINSHQILVECGSVVVDSNERDGAQITVWLSGGNEQETARVVCRITTSAGRVDDRSLWLSIANR